MKIPSFLILLFLIAFLHLPLFSNVRLPDIFSSHMVLQRDQKVPVWGEALPGEIVTVNFKDQTVTVTTGDDGNWYLELSPLQVSHVPDKMTITGINEIVLEDILVGEVWLCTGQSNMQWMLQRSEGGDEAIKDADYPGIRLFNVSRDVAFGRSKGSLATWQRCHPETVSVFSGVGYFFGLQLHRQLDVPIGLINSSYGGSQAEAWTPRNYLMKDSELKPCIDREKEWMQVRAKVQAEYRQKIDDWKAEVKKAKKEGSKIPNRPRDGAALRDYRLAASIYTTMIEPLIPFAIKGNIWYQGESNEERAEQYERLLEVMIGSWRDQWNQGDFPFGIVQLPNFRSESQHPEDKAWSHVRDAQRKVCQSVENTGLIVTIDIGEAADIHPPNKMDVGKRLSTWALSDVYGHTIEPSGPVYHNIEIQADEIIVNFTNTGKGLRTKDGKEPSEFAIASSDKKWYWAKAELLNDHQIKVWSSEVKNPVAIRYAFNNNPQHPNLTNHTGIPASPFRSDNWPGPTHGKR